MTDLDHACAGPGVCRLCAHRAGQADPVAHTPGKVAGQARAIRAADDPWKHGFREAVTTLARSGQPFTSEDVLAIVGLPSGHVGTNRNNAVGALMTALAKRGVIRKTGRRVPSRRTSSHGAELTEWIGATP